MSNPDRDRVLAHPDLAAKLCEPPLSYEHPGQWNGYVPPALYGQQINVCPRRAALVELIEEAVRRANTIEGDPA